MSLVELVVAITLIATIAALIIPVTQGDNLLQAKSVATVLRSDIELAQVMTMTDPVNPVVVQFDEEESNYWLAHADSPDIPLHIGENAELYLMTVGKGRLATADSVKIDSEALPDRRIGFDMNGGIHPPMSTPVITLNSGDAWVQLEISPMTGSITETIGTLGD